MPELPEVEAARRAVEDNCIGKKITKCVKTIVAGRRKGKNMWLQLDSPPFPSFQFGMAGAIYIEGVAVTKYKRSAVNDEEEWPSKYSKIFIQGANFVFDDLIKATHGLCAGSMYYITFQAKDGNYPFNSPTITFQTKVWDRIRQPPKFYSCFNKPT